jgi:hypothetical protein
MPFPIEGGSFSFSSFFFLSFCGFSSFLYNS